MCTPMETYKSILAYDGTDFHGYQRQAGAVRTVQGTVEAALRTLGWRGGSIRAAGRTDAGVHARGQVISFSLAWQHSCRDLLAAVNASLPPDVALRSCEHAPADFEPRYAARSRTYQYILLVDPVRRPLEERYAWRRWTSPNLDAMQAFAAALEGVHDFGAFGRAPIPGGHTRREVLQATWDQEGDRFIFTIEANAFLYHMVRRIVSIMVACGENRAAVRDAVNALQHPDQAWEGGIAPAHGLCLECVSYRPAVSG